MRVLVATHNYPRWQGDHAGAFVARLASGLRERGHDLLVVAPHAPGSLADETLNGVRIRRFRYAPAAWESVAYRGDMHRRPLASLYGAVALPAFLGAFAAAVRRAARDLEPDLVHAHWWAPAGALTASLGKPLVITCHGSDVRLLERSALVRRLGAFVFRRATAVTTVSDFLARDLASMLPAARGNVTTLRMPVDLDDFTLSARTEGGGPPRILYVGNLLESKGVADLIAAYALIRQRRIAATLRLVGRGPDEAAFRALTRTLGVESEVSWAGVVPHSEIASEYGAAAVTVLASRGQAEGLGLTLVEALATGSAVVGTEAGGIPEVVRHERTGLIARAGDPADLAQQIERLLSDDGLRRRLTVAGRQHVQQLFAAQPAITAYEALYRDTVRR